jgi:O-antigen/teichoic acid export membrane protein
MNAIVVTGQAALFLAGIVVIELLDLWSVNIVIGVSVLSAGIGSLVFLFLVPKTLLFAGDHLSKPAREPFWRLSLPGSLLKSSLDDSSANRFAFYMLLSKIIMLVTLRADVWLMGMFLDQSEIGLYNAASRFALPLSFVGIAVGTVLMPRASALANQNELRGLMKKTIQGSVAVTLLGSVYSIAVPFLAPWLFGEPFRASIGLGQLLCLGQCAVILANPISLLGYNLGLARIYWMIHLGQLCSVIIALLLFLPQFGAMAAALIFLASSLGGSAVTIMLVWRSAKVRGAVSGQA